MKPPIAAKQSLTDGLLAQWRIQHQPRLAALLFHQGLSQGRTVDFFVAEAPTFAIDHQAFVPTVRRVDEAPGRDPLQPRALTADAGPQPQAAAIAACGTHFEISLEFRCMALDQLTIENKPAGTEDDPVPGADSSWPGEIPFKLADPLPQFAAVTRGEILQALGTCGQARMQLRLCTAGRHAPDLGTEHASLSIDHQAFRRRLQQRPRASTQTCGLEVAIQHGSALPLADGTMSPGGRRQWPAVLRDQLVAGVIEKIAIRRVGGLATRGHPVAIGRSVTFQPLEVADAVGAEAPQGVVADYISGFMLEVIKHRFGGVVKTRGLLMPGAATGVDDPAAFGAGTATGKTVGNQHIRALGTRLERRASPGSAPANDQHITMLVPHQCIAVGDLQGGLDRGAKALIERRHSTSYRWLAKWLAAT